jgi:hypothetical protein
VPARFNLLASVFAAVLAAAGLRQLLAGISRAWLRPLVVAGLAVIAVADLSMVPYGSPAEIPSVPKIYHDLLAQRPRATFLEIPHYGSSGSTLNSVCGYWAAIHRGRTTAGYSGHRNLAYDNLIQAISPFDGIRLAETSFLAAPDSERLNIAQNLDYDSFVWLYLTYHGFDYVVLHQSELLRGPAHLERLKDRLRRALVHDDGDIAVYDRTRLAPPTQPVLMPTTGWNDRNIWKGTIISAAGRVARLAVYNPDAEHELVLTFKAGAFRRPRTVRLLHDGTELARWIIQPRELASLNTPPFRLPAGVGHLVLESDGEDRPVHAYEAASEGNRVAYSLRAGALSLRPWEHADWVERPAAASAARSEEDMRRR